MGTDAVSGGNWGKLVAPATGGEFSISLRDQAPCGYIAIWRARVNFFSAENPHPVVAGGPGFTRYA
jgi:hypothetical protein